MCAKYHYRLMGFMLLLFVIAATCAYAGGGIEWTNINDGLPNDIQIGALAADPGDINTIYAAGAGGVYRTTNGGSNWTNISEELTVLSNQDSVGKEQGVADIALAVDLSNIYLGCAGRIFKGTKDGSNWSDITGTMTIASWADLSIVVQSGSIYVGNDSGVYKSTDGGASWTKMNKSPMPVGTVSCRVVPGTTTGNLYALTYQGAFVTTDGGQSWGSISSSYFYDLLVYPDAMYATRWDGILKSVDGGVTWGTKTPGTAQGYPHIVCLAGHPGNSSILYACVETYQQPNGGMLNSLYTTTDGGNNWATVTTLSPSACVQDILVITNAVYAAGRGVHKSTDNGTSWSISNNGLPHHVNVNTIAADPKATGTLYIANDRGIFKSTDAGNSWSEKNTGLVVTYAPYSGFSCLTIDPNNSNIIYAGKSGSLYKSTDAGNSWGSITAGLIGVSGSGYGINISNIAIDPTNSQTIYVSGDWERMYKSTNGGTSWSKITIPQTSFAKLLIAPEDSSLLYAVPGWGSNIYRSNNSGSTWTTMPIGSNWQMNGIALGTTSQTIYAFGSNYSQYTGGYQSILGRLLKTIDSGNTWTQLSDEKVNPLLVNPDTTGILYGLGNDGVVKSIDDGKSWGNANQGLPMINTGKLISANRGSVGSIAFCLDPAKHERLYLNYPPYGLYRGTDTNTQPLPPTIQMPANGAKTSDPTPLIMGSSSPGSVVLVYELGTLTGTAIPDSSGMFSLVSAALTTGAHSLTAIAVDRFGTSSTTSLSLTIVPGVAPTIDSPVSGATNQATVTITGIAEDKATVVIYDELTPLATATSNGFYSTTIKLDDGLYRLYARSINTDGVIATSNIVELLIDTIAPHPPIITKPMNNSKTPIDKLTIEGYTIASSTVFIYLNSSEVGSCTSNSMGNFSFTTQEVLDGVYSITARVQKIAGSISQPSWPIKVTAGIPPVITNPVSGKTTKVANLTISGNCNSDAEIQIYLDSDTIYAATVTATNAGSFTYTFTALTAGTHTIKVKSVKNGKTSGFSNIVTLIIAPDLPIDPVGVSISSPRGTEHPMSTDEDSSVGVHWQQIITISVPVTGTPTHVYLDIQGTGTVEMTDANLDGIYEYSFKPYPLHGNVPMNVRIEYATSTTAPINIGSILIDPDGHVYNAVTLGKVTDAVVACYYFSTTTTTWVVWDAWNYPFNDVPQINPQTTTTGNDCYYSFMVPAGKYYVQAVCPGYYTYQSGVLEVINDPVHHDVYMEPIPMLTSMNISPQGLVIFPGGTYSFTAGGCRDQHDRPMPDAACNWSCGTGSFSPQANSSVSVFTAPLTTGTYIITAATGSVSATASVTVREPVSLAVSPANTYVRRGDVFTVDVSAGDVVDLSAARVVLSFDKTRLRAGTVSSGSFFKQGADSVSCQQNVRNDLGTVEINGARIVSTGSQGVTGSGTIYSVSFTAIVDDPRGTISITDVALVALKDANRAVICPRDIIPLGIRYRLLGDFGNTAYARTPDGAIGNPDLQIFAYCWNNKDMWGDIASTRTAGIAPFYTPEPDGIVGFDDLTIFAAMWYWDHKRGTSSFAPLLVTTPGEEKILTYSLEPMVRLESVLKGDEVAVDIVVEGVSNLLSGHFVIGYDADRLEVRSVNATFYRNDQPGVLDINAAGLGSLLQPGSIARVVFKKRMADNEMPSGIYLRTADLRMYQDGAVVPVFSPQIKQMLIPSDLNGAYCWPNPFVSGRGNQLITFSMLTKQARLRIYTIAGELVYDSSVQDTSAGSLTWDIKNQSGEAVASGVYLYLISNPEGQTKTGKLGVIR